MKKTLAVLLSICLVIALVPCTALAQESENGESTGATGEIKIEEPNTDVPEEDEKFEDDENSEKKDEEVISEGNGENEEEAVPENEIALLNDENAAVPLAEEEKGSLTVVKEGSDEAVRYEDNTWVLDEQGATYIVSGTASADERIIVAELGVTVKLSNAKIHHTTTDTSKYSPAIIMCAEGNIVLEGTNSVIGSPGCAGIFVSSGVTISGDGTLYAQGGAGSATQNINIDTGSGDVTTKNAYWGGGAGIGGNGQFINADTNEAFLPSVEFDTDNSHNIIRLGPLNFQGIIKIKSGNVIAQGGDSMLSEAGAGAGIGGGGETLVGDSDKSIDFWDKGVEPCWAQINIEGGYVKATGGNADSTSMANGGAGIGSGGNAPGWIYNFSMVDISAGTVEATGKGGGAGIGGGANKDGGQDVKITGGNVTAVGGEGKDGIGGAGIGGGDNGGSLGIEITSGKVYAKAGGAAAGIGSGNNGYCGGVFGTSQSEEEGRGEIRITGDADVTAIGGNNPTKTEGGAGIGTGRKTTCSNKGFGHIIFQDTPKIKAYAGKGAQAIGLGANQEIYKSEYTNKDMLEIYSSYDSDVELKFFTQDDTPAFPGQDISREGSDYLLDPDIVRTSYNIVWYNMPKNGIMPAKGELTKAYSVDGKEVMWKYDDSKIQVIQDGKVIAEMAYDAPLASWAMYAKTLHEVTFVYDDGTKKVVTADENDMIEKPEPDPVKEGYKFVGWYEKGGEDDGEFFEEPFDFSGSARGVSYLFPKWEKITTPDVKTCTLSYDLNGGKGDFAAQTVKYGDSVTLKGTPTKDGYTFAGWSANGKTYKEGDKIKITADTVLTAQWTESSGSGSGNGSGNGSTNGTNNGNANGNGTNGTNNGSANGNGANGAGNNAKGIKTGYESNMTLFAIIAAAAAAGIVIAFVILKKRKRA